MSESDDVQKDPQKDPQGDPQDDPQGFLARWSHRKFAVIEDAAPAPDEAPPEAPKPPAVCPIPGVQEIDLASLPKLEDLTIASDLGPFLRVGVPSGLRNAALRRMWSLDPEIRDFINSVECQWDFNTPGGLPNGFSDTLVGDVGRMLAQAIGLDAKGKSPADHAAEEAAAAPPEPLAESRSVEEPSEPVMQALLEAPEPAPPEPQAPRRRHGSALPV